VDGGEGGGAGGKVAENDWQQRLQWLEGHILRSQLLAL
jgi:hypothetical protein